MKYPKKEEEKKEIERDFKGGGIWVNLYVGLILLLILLTEFLEN